MSRKCPKCETVFSGDTFFCGFDGTITIEVQDPGDFDPRLGDQLGAYIVAARVADGAMGRVYEGRHPETKQRVAIKVLHEEVAKDDVAVERFKREYETASELKHPHVVEVLEFGQTEDGSYFLNMQFLQGEELGGAIRRDGIQSVARTVRVIAQVAGALDLAHSFGVVHRDLKPDNIFLCETDEGDHVRLLDFGSVKLQVETGPKLTAFGTTLGSPYYMSPEQAMGKADVDQRTDVFAISTITYEMLTGTVAFDGKNVGEILMAIVNKTPPPASGLNPDVPQSVDDVIEKGVSKDKAQRYASASEYAQALITALGLTGTPADFAAMSTTDIEAALATAVPPEPVPFGGEAAMPSAIRNSEPVPEDEDLIPAGLGGGGSKVALLVGGAITLFALLAGVAAFFLLN